MSSAALHRTKVIEQCLTKPSVASAMLIFTDCHSKQCSFPSAIADPSCSSKNLERKMESAFEPWIGQAVVVQLTLGRIRLSFRGTLVKDRTESVLLRPDAGPEIEIPKANVLAVEQATPYRTFAYAFHIVAHSSHHSLAEFGSSRNNHVMTCGLR